MIKELRKWLSVKLIDYAFTVMPTCYFKLKLAKFIEQDLWHGMDH